MRLIPGFHYGLRSILLVAQFEPLLVQVVSLTMPLNYGTASGSMKGLSRKKFHPSRQKFLAASHSTHPKPFNANQHASC